MRHKRFLLGVVGLLFASSCIAADEQVDEAVSAIDVAPLPTLERTVKSIVDEEVGPRTDASGHRNYVGLSVIVIKNGVRYRFHYGEAVLGSGLPATGTTYYGIGSITKTFTATLLALYDHRGVVSLGTKLVNVTSHPVASPRDQITLEQLATHHSGLVDQPPGGESAYHTGTYSGDMDKLMDTLGTCTTENPCNAPIPNTSSDVYSNYGYAVLGRVLSKRSSSTPSVQAALSAGVIDPLGLSDTDNKAHLTEDACVIGTCAYADYGECTYSSSCNKTFSARAAIGYLEDQTTRDSDEGSDDNIKAGSGVLWSTPYDMTDWLAYNMGIGNNVPQELQSILPVILTPRAGDMALAWRRVTTPGGRSALAKSGVLNSFRSHMAFLEDRSIGVVVLRNSDNAVGGGTAGDLAYAILDALNP
jgi:CubicO group peptidase (beta-lactamase class C family)